MLRPIAGLAAAAVLLAAGSAPAAPGSLARDAVPRPGPQALYAKPKPAPQLRNRGPWEAKPLLVSGASAYRDGEFLYQDYIYDDHGARGTPDPADPRTSFTFARVNGTYRYPTAPVYAQNAADLVELRVKPLRRSTAFRITLNAMHDPQLVATTIAIGRSPQPRELPHGAGVAAPARFFLTVHGRKAELVDAATGEIVDPKPRAKVSVARNQIDVRVPRRAWNPRRKRVRMAAGVGLWDRAAGAYLQPAAAADADTPGGAGGIADPPALFNLAFRYTEPAQSIGDVGGIAGDPKWWRDDAQAEALGSGDISGFSALVDFAKLRRGTDDALRGRPAGVPRSGPMNAIVSSRYASAEGADWGAECMRPVDCPGKLTGALQPYSLYVPRGKRPARGWGLTLLLHSLGANHNQFTGSANQSQIGEQGRGSIVITPAGRGPDGWYYGRAEADVFEVWADVARRFRLDPGRTAISGYSMGGYGTYKLAVRYPDLFARANPVVGPPGLGVWAPPAEPLPGGRASNTRHMLASVRHVPFLIWAGAVDELVPVASTTAQADRFDELGLRYRFDLFPTADHFALAVHDQYEPAARFLAASRVVRKPARVTYAVNPAMDFPGNATVADHAYWLSGMRVRDASGPAPLGEVDAVSHALGRGDAPALPTRTAAGTLAPGRLGSMPYTERSKAWGPAPRTAERDALTLRAANLATVKVHARRAGLSCDAKLDVQTDGPLTVRLAGCDRNEVFR